MRLFGWKPSISGGFTNSIGAITNILMFLHISSTIILTLTHTGTHAASLESISNRKRHRSKTRQIRDTQDRNSSKALKILGERECTEAETHKMGCMSGRCAAIVASKVNTFVLCRCPSNRHGARCEIVAINTDAIAEKLIEQSDDELCKKEHYDKLSQKSVSFLLDCARRNNYKIAEGDKPRLTKREKKRRERQKARRKKLRRRQRRREKKRKGMRLTERATDGNSNTNRQSSQTVSPPAYSRVSSKDARKQSKTHKGHNHKTRHAHTVQKSPNRRRRKSLTTFLLGTTSAPRRTTLTPPPGLSMSEGELRALMAFTI